MVNKASRRGEINPLNNTQKNLHCRSHRLDVQDTNPKAGRILRENANFCNPML